MPCLQIFTRQIFFCYTHYEILLQKLRQWKSRKNFVWRRKVANSFDGNNGMFGQENHKTETSCNDILYWTCSIHVYRVTIHQIFYDDNVLVIFFYAFHWSHCKIGNASKTKSSFNYVWYSNASKIDDWCQFTLSGPNM